ncbi:hypothetical protein ACFPFP_08415 [Bradyrhizobium sp. GCM10023182]|nr:hypothetical protein [Bradyrhizobium zhengyangense]
MTLPSILIAARHAGHHAAAVLMVFEIGFAMESMPPLVHTHDTQ